MYCILFMHSSVVGHLGCFHILAVVNSASMDIGVHVFFKLWLSQGIHPVVGLRGHMVVLFLVFKGVSMLFSIVAVSIYIPTNSARTFPFLQILSSIYYLLIFFYFNFFFKVDTHSHINNSYEQKQPQ